MKRIGGKSNTINAESKTSVLRVICVVLAWVVATVLWFSPPYLAALLMVAVWFGLGIKDTPLDYLLAALMGASLIWVIWASETVYPRMMDWFADRLTNLLGSRPMLVARPIDAKAPIPDQERYSATPDRPRPPTPPPPAPSASQALPDARRE